ncbi:MAG: hypothetical protein V4793_03635 [Paraburkholderia tropica]
MHRKTMYLLGFACLTAIGLASCKRQDVASTANSQAEVIAVANYDVLNNILAKRVREQLGVADANSTTQVLVTNGGAAIGAVYRTGGRWIPYNDSSCTFPDPQRAALPSAFPSYQISKTLALSMGLDNELIQALSKFDVKLSDASSFSFSVEKPIMQVVSDTALTDGIEKPNCKAALKAANGDLYIVRGYISGKRTFRTSVDATRLVEAGIKKIASFDINAGGGKTLLEISDSEPSSFLQILELERYAAPAPVAYRPVIPTIDTLLPVRDTAHNPDLPSIVYIQQNSADAKSVGNTAQSLLSARGIRVASDVESLEKTPSTSQVRYFRDADRNAAEQVASQLSSRFRDIEPIRSKVPGAKAGQLEVWLSKQP